MQRLTVERLDEILERVRGIRVLVVGDIMLDRYLRGTASRISPEAPVPVVRIADEWRALGGAANVAANVVALGAACTIAGCVGADTEADAVRDELRSRGVDDSGVLIVPGRPTTVKTRIMARHHQIARYDREVEDDLDGEPLTALAQTVERLCGVSDAIVLEDYNKGVLSAGVVRSAITVAGRRGIPVVVDPKARGFFAFGGATVFKPNLIELEAALQTRARPDDPTWMEQARERLDCDQLLLTLGEEGMALRTATGEYVRIPAVARAVFDVSGAGDTVTAAMAVALSAGASPAEAAVLANHAAAIEVGKPGVATVTATELRAAVRTFMETSHPHSTAEPPSE
jgi:rfaE bifunctional protein kinase chain/domain